MKKIFFIVVASCMVTFSCDKKLNQVNPNQPTTETFWQTKAQAFAGVTAIYNALINDGTYMRSFPGLTDSRGDDFTGDSPWLDLDLTGQFIIGSTSDPVAWIWRDFYMVVNRANQVIEHVSNYDESVLSTEEKNRLLGQAYFLRGLAYYNLATSFKTVPLVLTTAQSNADFYPPTATEEELWNQIFSDLQTAEADLPVSYANISDIDQGQIGRATKGAAAGLLGKAYLYRKDYTNAGAQFEKFITGELKNVYSLVPSYQDNFTETAENNSESLFEVQFAESGGTAFNWTGDPSTVWKTVQAISITYGMEGAGFSDYLPTRWIYNEYKKEKTVDGGVDPRLLATLASYEPEAGETTAYGMPWDDFLTQKAGLPNDTSLLHNKIYPKKYTRDNLGVPAETTESGINYRVLRYADILLMYAEVLNETGKTAEAYPYIQQVRDRAHLPNLAAIKPNMTQEEMRDQLAHERALEFAIEGQRINDLIRWGWFANPEKLAELKSHDNDFNTYTPGNEYLPIPQQELDANQNITPNPAN